MTLRDHFRPPIHPPRSWESFFSNWCTRIADSLTAAIPERYIAGENESEYGCEVRVFEASGGLTLVGVVELVSPSNKDRPEERRAFAAKTAGYLAQGVSVVVADIVTGRRANLHNELLPLLGPAAASAAFPADVPLYAAAYRPVTRGEADEIDIWTEELRIGSELPTMPLRLTGELFVPVDLAATYSEACRRRGIA